MIRVAIIEDDEKTLNELNSLCSRYFTESDQKFTINLFKSGIDFISAFVVATIDKDPKKRLVLKMNGNVVIIPADSVCYVEIVSHSAVIHTDKQTYRLNETLTEIENYLGNVGFARCNHSYLVNLSCVTSVTGSDVCVSVGDKQEVLKMSRNKKTAFIEALVAFTR